VCRRGGEKRVPPPPPPPPPPSLPLNEWSYSIFDYWTGVMLHKRQKYGCGLYERDFFRDHKLQLITLKSHFVTLRLHLDF